MCHDFFDDDVFWQSVNVYDTMSSTVYETMNFVIDWWLMSEFMLKGE